MKLTLLTIFLLLSKTTSLTQNISNKQILIQCTYKFSFKKDSTSNSTSIDYHILQIGKNFSKYKSKGQIMADSLSNIFSIMPFDQNSAQYYIQQRNKLPANRTSFTIYKYYETNIIRFVDIITINDYYYDESTKIFNWVTSNDKSIVNGYPCQKASCAYAGRIWEVWFTRQIPVSDGPYKFSGLPGLIIKAKDSKNNFSFELISLKNPTKNNFISYDNMSEIKQTTRDKFRRAKENSRINGLAQMEASGDITFKDKDNSRTIHRMQSNRKYNPLEIK